MNFSFDTHNAKIVNLIKHPHEWYIQRNRRYVYERDITNELKVWLDTNILEYSYYFDIKYRKSEILYGMDNEFEGVIQGVVIVIDNKKDAFKFKLAWM